MPGALPTYLIIGVAKCGTTSLHNYLGRHPEIQASRRKELLFFVDAPEDSRAGMRPPRRGNWQRGVDWYRSWFSPDFRVRGEASPGYMSPAFPGTAERIHSVVPDAKLILCVRDPVARVFSHYRHSVNEGDERRPPEAAITPDSHYVRTSRYAVQLAPYLNLWDRAKIHVVSQEHLLSHRRESLSEVFEFLGVAPDHWCDSYDALLNVSAPRSGPAWWALRALRRRPWWHQVATRVPPRVLPKVDRVTASRGEAAKAHSAPPPELVELVADTLADDTQRFREVTGKAFASWPV